MLGRMKRGLEREFVGVRAERTFQKIVFSVGQSLTPSLMESMAQQGITVAQLMQDTGQTIPKLEGVLIEMGVRHVSNLSKTRLLELIREALPEHASVFDRYPAFADQVAQDLKLMVLSVYA